MLPCPPPGNLPGPGIEPVSLSSPALGGGLFTTGEAPELVGGYDVCNQHDLLSVNLKEVLKGSTWSLLHSTCLHSWSCSHKPGVLLFQLPQDVHHHGQEGLVSCVALGRDRDSCHPTMAEETQHHHIYLPGEWWAKPRSAAETSVPTAGTQGTWVISWETC